MTTERTEPVLVFAQLEEVKQKRVKGAGTEYTARLTAWFDKADLPHLATLQERVMQVAFTPAPLHPDFEPS
ncbi:MAG TPA: hypothetical protein VIB47_07150 [Dehalococcoidia bacterium]|jgi:hypothetical protein